ncbi:hypothetical protein QUT48_22535 [Xanthomonas citri pv. citri]
MITFVGSRSRTFWYAIAGLIIGLFVGHFIGGVGVATRGGAFGVNSVIVLAVAGIIGAAVGYCGGRRHDRKKK